MYVCIHALAAKRKKKFMDVVRQSTVGDKYDIPKKNMLVNSQEVSTEHHKHQFSWNVTS